MEAKKNVGIWLRVSTEFQVKDESPEHHKKRAQLYAEAKGWQVKEIYQLDAVSGKSVMEQPETKRMLKDLRSGRITGLIFSKLARLARNTKELLEFSEIFRSHDADLISLSEAIDTSSSAGRLFYTMIAALSEWERSEIAERVAASVPIRAKMGKPLGGAAPYGYQWVDKDLVIDESEAPIRKLMYDLFLEHKRKATVADQLNLKGYRTRNGSQFSDTTVGRLLRDPIAKGQRRANYTKSLGENKKWVIKPESEWVVTECPAIVSEEVWNTCNSILDQQEVKRTPRARKSVHLFAGVLTCHCGGKMYVPSRTNKYTCTVCKKTRIDTVDIESIYFEQLKSFLLTKNDLSTFLSRANEAIQSKEEELILLQKDKIRIKDEMGKLIQLHNKNQIPTEGFGEFYNPLDAQLKQIEASIPEVQAQLDYIKIQQLNGDHILHNAENLYDRWPKLQPEAKRQIVEELTEAIVISDQEISIKFCYSPSFSQNPPTSQHNVILALPFWKVRILFKNPFFRKFQSELKTIGDHIRKRRIELGLIQKEVACALKVSEDTVTFWENNRVKPMIHHLPVIIQFLGYNPLLMDKETLGGQIKCYRIMNGLSHKELGKLLQVDASTVGSWEAGQSVPHFKSKKKLLTLLLIH